MSSSEHVTAYEPQDVDLGPVTIASLILLAITLAILFLFYGLVQVLETQAAKREAVDQELEMVVPTAPAPRVQPNPIDNRLPKEDMSLLREQEAEILDTYGQVSPEVGIVRVPIDVAIEKLAEEGLPARTE